MFADARRAIGLLTIFPAGKGAEGGLMPGRAMAFYPLVGAAIGGVLAGVAALLHWSGVSASAPMLSAAIVLALWVALTGGLHLDGWADCCDALFVPVDRARRLEIMKDSRLGGFGSIGLILLLLVKFAALQGVLGKPHATFALVGVVAVARWAAVAGAFWFKSARPGGMGDYFRTGLTRSVLVAATVLGLTAAAALLWRESVVWAAVLAAFLAFAFFARSRLGGLTGDVYGGIIELAETAALTVLCFV